MTTVTREQTRQKYATGADEYDRVRLEDPRGQLLSEHDRDIFRQLLPPASGNPRVLEVGAGTGRFTIEALARGFSLTATDINEPMLERLRTRLSELGFAGRCRTEIRDVFNLGYEAGSFDLIFTLHVIPRFLTWDDQAAALTSITHVLAPGGKLIFNYRNRKSFYNLLYKGPAATPHQVESLLRDQGLRMTAMRGKWLLNKSLLRKLPLWACRVLAALDRALLRFCPRGAWDVFVVAVKDQRPAGAAAATAAATGQP